MLFLRKLLENIFFFKLETMKIKRTFGTHEMKDYPSQEKPEGEYQV